MCFYSAKQRDGILS